MIMKNNNKIINSILSLKFIVWFVFFCFVPCAVYSGVLATQPAKNGTKSNKNKTSLVRKTGVGSLKNQSFNLERDTKVYKEEETVIKPSIASISYSDLLREKAVSNRSIYQADLASSHSTPEFIVRLSLELLTYDDLALPLKVQIITASESNPALVESVIETSCQQDSGLTEWSDGVVNLECSLDPSLVSSVDIFDRSLLVIELPDSSYYANAVLAHFSDVQLSFSSSQLIASLSGYQASFDLSSGECFSSPSHAALYQENIEDFNRSDNLSDEDCENVSSRLILPLNLN